MSQACLDLDGCLGRQVAEGTLGDELDGGLLASDRALCPRDHTVSSRDDVLVH